MDWDDNNGYNDMDHASQRDGAMPDKNAKEGFDPMDIVNPVSAYFFLSDDVQDEITGSNKKRMKCRSCGHRFTGEFYESCPKCYSANTNEVIASMDHKDEIAEEPNMKCLDCGHTFVGETYDSCPECFSSDIEQMTEGKDAGYW